MRHKNKHHKHHAARSTHANTEIPQASETAPTLETNAEVVKKDSVVDALFDTATAWAVQGLKGTQRGLEAAAHWLEGRAKVIGELAVKIAGDPGSTGASAEQQAA